MVVRKGVPGDDLGADFRQRVEDFLRPPDAGERDDLLAGKGRGNRVVRCDSGAQDGAGRVFGDAHPVVTDDDQSIGAGALMGE